MVDEGLILRKLADLEEYLEQLKEFQGVTLDAYLSDWKTQRIVERTLQMMIETCADIAGHIISDKGFRIPKSYADTFRVLEDNKVIEPDLLPNMVKMSKFRNVIVHQYDNVDAEIITGILRNNIHDFVEFKDCIVTFLKKEKDRTR